MLLSEKPKLRALDVRRVRREGGAWFLLRDPEKVTRQELLVPEHFGPILALFDGRHGAEEVAARIEAAYGVRVGAGLVEEVARTLDEALMLDNARYREQVAVALAEYRGAAFRAPALAGAGYPEEPAALWALLQDYLEGSAATEPAAVDWASGVGLLSPHIDFGRGGAVYAGVWKRAARAAVEADLVVIFGTDHQGDDAFTLTRQNYATPYGVLPTAQGVVDALAGAIGEEAAFAGELRHRGEHSLELVLTWLHHLRAGAPVEVVPVLCGSLHGYMGNGDAPRADRLFARVLEALHGATVGRRVLVVASGDLAHVGSAFGQKPLTDAALERVYRADMRLIGKMATGDADGFFEAIKGVQNRNNVCGVAPIYLTMRAVGGLPGEALGYRACPADDEGTSMVTVTGVLFHAGAGQSPGAAGGPSR